MQWVAEELLASTNSTISLEDRAAGFRLLLRQPATASAAWQYMRGQWSHLMSGSLEYASPPACPAVSKVATF